MAQQPSERKQLFDHDWKFFLGDAGAAGSEGYSDRQWRTLDLPHDWSIEGEFNAEYPTSGGGGYVQAGIGWYRKTFEVPASWEGQNVSIYFEGVYMNAEVFINGQSLGVHPYGYTSFTHDLSPFLHFGEENVIAVRVDNSQQTNCRWYSGSGIYRHVWLRVTHPIHIPQWGVAITTPEISSKRATVEIRTRVKNETDVLQQVELSTHLSRRGREEETPRSIAKSQTTIDVQPGEEREVLQTFRIKKTALWTPETPNLYEAQLSITQNGETLDGVEIPFGVRTISFSAEEGFKLNGESVIFNGGCVHHDNGCLGAKAYDRAEERKVELLKAAGFNAVRTSHNPPSEAFLEACDRLGLLVIDEIYDGWRDEKTPFDHHLYIDEWWQRDVASMVLRDRNHPSIVMWSSGNEIIERTNPEAVETADMLNSYIRSLDPTRPVTSAMTTWGQGWEIFDPLFATHDVGGYNYQLHYAESDHERVPSRIILQTESYPKDAFFCWDMADKHDYIIGDFVWTAMDYLGESGIGRYYYPGEPDGEHWEAELFPWHGAYCGDIDLLGWRKPISHYRDMLYNGDEMLYLAVREPNPHDGKIKLTSWAVWPTWESWTWPGYEGQDVEVEVYSRYPKVRLYLDGKLIGEQPTTRAEEFKATFSVPYQPGELKAVGVVDGEEHSPAVLKTASGAAKIQLHADRIAIHADGQDLSFVIVEILDENGVLQADAEHELQFEVEGPGSIIAVDNGDLRDTDSYVGTTRHAWNGRAMVVVKSSDAAGEIRLSVSSPGLEGASLIISSK